MQKTHNKATPLTGIATLKDVTTTPAGEVKITADTVRDMNIFLTPEKALTLASALTQHALSILHPHPETEGTVDAVAAYIDPDAARRAVARSIAEYGSRLDWDSDLNELIPMHLSGLIDIDDLPDWTDQSDEDIAFWANLKY